MACADFTGADLLQEYTLALNPLRYGLQELPFSAVNFVY